MKRARRLAAKMTEAVQEAKILAGGADEALAGTTLSLASEAILRDFPGAALVTDGAGRVLGASETAAPLVTALNRGSIGQLAASISRTLASGAHCESITVATGETFDLAFVPLVGDGVLVVGLESTLSRNLQRALVDSRRRYKDLVECSSDFAWEVGSDGTFTFVSPRGALGYEAKDLVGLRPQDLVHERHDDSTPLPFHSTVPAEGATVWLRAADGSAACVETSSIPLFDRGGGWTGVRGLCRDVTEARARDEALARARRREDLVTGLVNTIREEVDPEMLLARAADSTGRALGVTLCWIYRLGDDGAFVRAAMFGSAPDDAPDDALVAAFERMAGESRVDEVTVAGRPGLATTARHRRGVNGAVCVARDADANGWSDDDYALVAAVGEHLGIAIEQIANHEALLRLSRTDELTGLLNRRAFTDELRRRHGHALRTGRAGSLLYVDLDNFKLVNDVHGHQRGDEALKEWAEVLSRNTRVGDVPARLGGDEFAVWLEETDEQGAIAKAKELLASGSRLARFSGDSERPLCVSVGVAVFDPASDESLDELVTRADGAMYEAKRGGKGKFAIAPPAAMANAEQERS
ncbi:MAG: diguanylate cyclase [Alphaproteobacteria bacterium]